MMMVISGNNTNNNDNSNNININTVIDNNINNIK